MERIPAVDTNGNQLVDAKGRPAYVWDRDTPNSRPYFWRILHWISQGGNVITGGHQDLTLSCERLGWWQLNGFGGLKRAAYRSVNWIFGDQEHSLNAWRHKV